MAQQPTLTVSAAVEAFEIERRTLQKMLSEDRLPGAYKDSRGRWIVPIAALHQTGIPARKTWISDANTFANGANADMDNQHEINDSDANVFANNDANKNRNGANGANGGVPDPHEINDSGAIRDANTFANGANADANDLRAHVALLQVQLDAEKEKNEQLRDNLADVRRAMLMLEAANPTPLSQPVEEVPAETRRGWWQRHRKP